MTYADAIMFGTVAFVLVPASLRSPVALALLVWWSVGMVAHLTFGALPPWFAFVADLLAMAVVLRLAASSWDLVVAALFISSLASHAWLPPYEDWLASWAIGIAQFLFAGAGALQLRSWKQAEDRARQRRTDLSDTLRAALRSSRYGS